MSRGQIFLLYGVPSLNAFDLNNASHYDAFFPRPFRHILSAEMVVQEVSARFKVQLTYCLPSILPLC